MVRPSLRTALTLGALWCLAPPVLADDKKTTGDPGKPAARAAAEKAARDALAQFDRGDPGWKARMRALVQLAKAGPDAVPVLVGALKDDSPSAREFAAQALVMFADPAARPALERALGDPKSGVRIHAIQALSMLGRLERTEEYERMRNEDPSRFGVRPMMAAALGRTDRPDPAALRKTLAGYDLRNLGGARVGEMAPDFTLADFQGKTHRLSHWRGKKAVVLRFILFDF